MTHQKKEMSSVYSKYIEKYLKPYTSEDVEEVCKSDLKKGFHVLPPEFLEEVKKNLEKRATLSKDPKLSEKLRIITKHMEGDFIYNPKSGFN